MKQWHHRVLSTTMVLLASMEAGCEPVQPEPAVPSEPQACFLADLTGELREPTARGDGIYHVDTPSTIAKLQELHVRTYLYWIGHAPTDWADLAEFLPAAERTGIDVWIYLLPPSGCTTSCSEPYGTDFVRWAKEIAILSVDHPNLKGYMMDDFDDNLFIFNAQYLNQMRNEASQFNSKLQFIPVVYMNAITPWFVETYAPMVDGICLAFRDDPYRNTQRSESLLSQIATVNDLVKPLEKPFYLMVYADGLSRTPMAPRAAYVDDVMTVGLQAMSKGTIAGLITYNLRKDGKPDAASANLAQSGTGHYTLGIPAGVPTNPSARGGITQTVMVDPTAGVHRLNFWRRDPSSVPAELGRAHLELLVNGQVAWQEDLAVSSSTDWISTEVNLHPFLMGLTSATITFDLVDDNSADTYFVLARIDNITAEGFTVRNGDIETTDDWQFEANHPAILGAIDLFNANRPLDIFDVVKKQFGTFMCK